MLIILRILFAFGLWYFYSQARTNAQLHPDTGDIANAGYLALCVIMAILNAVVWAPFLGARISEPITGALTSGAVADHRNRLLQLIYWLQEHHCRRLTLLACFLEGIRYPWLPSAFVIGFKNAPPGSWWEKIFAREVFRFNNTQNCVVAYQALKRHGIHPGSHRNAEISLVLLALEREPRPDAEIIPLPAAPKTMPVKRDSRIQLFEMDGPARTGKSAPTSGGRPKEQARNEPPNPSLNPNPIEGRC